MSATPHAPHRHRDPAAARGGPTLAAGLIGWLLLCFGAAAMGAFFPPGEWYQSIAKPSWTPPGWLFGPVWTVLYALMAVAAWRVWRTAPAPARSLALGLMLAQLVLNAAWSPLFFGLRSPALAFVDICALWLALVWTMVAFRRVDAPAGWMLVPYLAWVSFALVLNGAIWQVQ
jgi:tryptophan-rich sensory protein